MLQRSNHSRLMKNKSISLPWWTLKPQFSIPSETAIIT